jgi:hypothetical protein
MAIKGVRSTKKKLNEILKQYEKDLKTTLQVRGKQLQTHTRVTYLRGGTSDTRLRMRTGKFAASTRALPLKKVEGGWSTGLGFGTKYAAVHVGPEGRKTEITPKKKKFLAIPLPAAMTGGGVLRGKPLDDSVWGETFIAKSKKGNLIIFGKKVSWSGSGRSGAKVGQTRGKLVPLFVLKTSVKVKTRVHPQKLIDFIEPKIIKDLEKTKLKITTARAEVA